MTKFNTLLRVVYTLGVSLILSAAAYAQTPQTVLNFAKATVNERTNARFAVTNPTASYADVKFTFYGLDGNPVSSGFPNPVQYRVAPKGQVSMRASDLFATSRAEGWVQATSPTQGLTGAYWLGDFSSALEGGESATPMFTQVMPLIRDDQTNKTEVDIVNPGVVNGDVTITFFNAFGVQLGTFPRSIAAHASLRITPSSLVSNLFGGNLSARISASVPVVAAAIIDRGDSLLLAPGQPVDQAASMRVVPHYINGNGYDPILIVNNPNGSPVSVTVTLMADIGVADPSAEGQFSRKFDIPGNGSISITTRSITGQVVTPPATGWLRVDSPNVALGGLLVLDRGQAVTGVSLQSSPLDRIIYSQVSQTESTFTGLALVNPAATVATLDVSLVRTDGSVLAQKTATIAPNAKLSALISDIMAEAAGQTSGYIYIRSSVPIYGVGMLGAANNAFLASMPPIRMADTFFPNVRSETALITRIDSSDVRAGTTLRVLTNGASGDSVFLLGNQVVPSQPSAFSGLGVFFVDVPAVEPGFLDLRLRSNGVDSPPVTLHVLPPDNGPTQTFKGRAFYQKIEVTDAGLDLTRPVMLPIRSARIEVVDRFSESILAVSETDPDGQFQIPVPLQPDLTLRVLSRLRSSDLRVADNTNLNTVYAVSLVIDGRQADSNLLVTDRSRLSGAFNILEMIQRANETVKLADPKVSVPPVTIFWSTRNTNRAGNPAIGLVGTSYFNIANNTAFILGDRNVDSDEFDDAVIIHEYAHMLAAKFSRDDSPGGAHMMGDMLDPRVAWSEGWANFFSSAVRNDPIWRDSSGPNGVTILRYDLEDNVPPGDKEPGYWSEASVDTLLWDLYDARPDAGDNVQYPFSQIWSAFADLRNDHFIYLPYFLEHFLARNPSATDAVTTMAQVRKINLQPNVRPSVTNPFPTPMNVGSVVTGFVDSLNPKRNNLVTSSHFYSFTTTGGAASIRLDITGLGAGDNPNANDLDLFLMDANGRVLERSDRGLNGQSELVSVRLPATSPAATYVVEIRSFYTKAETVGFVFNSGQYRLAVSVQ